MRIFTLDEVFNVACNSESTRSGFRHIAVLHKNGFKLARAKCIYFNRTWECYEFETVLKRCIDDNFEGAEHKKYINKIKRTM